MRRKFPKLFLASLASLAMLASACGSSKSDSTAKESTSTTVTEVVPDGGTLVVGLEQEPDCTDWMGSCGGSSYGYWSMNVTTMPFAYKVQQKGSLLQYVPTNVLTGEAKLETSPKQTVTYTINPKAKWSDGQPITSADFKYTWDQVANGKDIYDRTGYADIESVDATKPDTAIVTFKKPFSDWKQLFGGGFGIYPAHILEGKDRNAEAANGYKWSGGPWMIDHWTKGVEATLVPNPQYWGDKPHLDKVIFKFITDTSAEFLAFKAGEVLAIKPQPQLDAIDQIVAGLPDVNAKYTANTANAEALWMHNGKAPFDDINFRKAVAYSIDRDAIVNRLFGGIGVKKALQTLTAPILTKYAQLDAFSGYSKNLSKVSEFMKKSGWAKGTDGIWAKGGEKASFEIKSTTGNKRREITEQVLQSQLKEAGFEMTISNHKSGDLFGDILPKGDYQVALFANSLTSFAPSNCNLFCSKNIPTAANDYSGNGWYRVNVPALDTILERIDATLDPEVAQADNRKADKLLAANMVTLPLDPLPEIFLSSKKIVGPIDDNPILGPFWNMEKWGLKA